MASETQLQAIGTEPLQPGAAWERDSLSLTIAGLGGLGVMGLTRLLCEVLLARWPRVAATETRGIAQRRAPVHALVRAGRGVRSALPPDRQVDLLVALEAGEALRALPLLRPGSLCLLCDLVVPAAGASPPPSACVVEGELRRHGVAVAPVRAQHWLARVRAADALVSSIAFGALAAILRLPAAACEATLARRAPGARRAENLAAFRWGNEQTLQRDAAPESARDGTSAASPVVAEIAPQPALALAA